MEATNTNELGYQKQKFEDDERVKTYKVKKNKVSAGGLKLPFEWATH